MNKKPMIFGRTVAGIEVAALAVLLASGAHSVMAGGFAETAVEPKVALPELIPPVSDDRPCAKMGLPKGWEPVGESSFCRDSKNALFAYAGYSMADEDVFVYGVRSPNGQPIMWYGPDDVSDDTKYPYAGAWFTHETDIAGKTGLGPTLFHLSLAFNLEASANGDGDLTLVSNAWDDYEDKALFYPGLVNEAWVRVGGFQVGIQPSRFDFIHTGYTLSESYVPKTTTLSASYTYRPNKSFSFAVAAEDWERRNLDDGVLARYGDQDVPDLVAQMRYTTGPVLYHAAVARHQIADDIGTAKNEDVGRAGTLAVEYKYSWAKILGGESKGMGLGGRIFGSVVAAEGAMGYLGAPFFATDYVTDAQGDLDLSTGQSAALSIENIWRPDLRSMLTVSYFQTKMSTNSDLPADPNNAVQFGQEIEASGTRLSLGIEKIASKSVRYGVVGSMNWTEVVGQTDYAETVAADENFDGVPVSSEYPEIMIYLSKRF